MEPVLPSMTTDRMGYFLPTMTASRLQAQQQVVRSERRQRYENAPYGEDRFATAAGLYPVGHPLRTLDNVVATPHIGYVADRPYRIFFRDAVAAISAWLDAQ